MKRTTFSSVPRDARHAASRGFNFREGFFEVEDAFVDANKMARRGTMEISDGQGNRVKVPFTSMCTFGKPVPVSRSAAA
jgi:hypothetical protein